MKIWLVKHPTHQYLEDVSALAALHNLKIIDAQFASHYLPEQIAENPPLLSTLETAVSSKQPLQAAPVAEPAMDIPMKKKRVKK